MLINFISVGLGAFFGAIIRYGINILVAKLISADKPAISTFIVNIVGSFLMGLLFSYFNSLSELKPELRLILITGFLGSFTTFSTFSMENYIFLIEGEYIKFLIYSILSIVIGVIMIWVGIKFYEQI